MGGSYIVGLAGGSASGKTTMVNELANRYPSDSVAVLSQDNYYKPLSLQHRDEAGVINFDLPQGVDFQRLRTDIRRLSSGKMVRMPEYTFNNPSRFPRWLEIHPAPIVLVEGLFIYADPWLRRMFHWKVMVEVGLEDALERRLRRDVNERGMRREEVLYQWQKHVLPSYERHVHPYRGLVDLFVNNSGDVPDGLTAMENHFDAVLGA